MERQSASIEQMKHAKTRVESHREANLVNGKAVRQDVHGWKEAMYCQQNDWVEHGKSLKDKVMNSERQRAEREALLALKKKLSQQVKVEILQLVQDGKNRKEEVLASNREQASRIRGETGIEVHAPEAEG